MGPTMQSWILLSFLIVSVFTASAVRDSTLGYCYKEDDCNPYMWVKLYPSCLPQKDKLHSPIDLSDEALRNDSIPSLKLQGFVHPQASWTVTNVRDTVVVEFKEGMTVSGGWLKYEYRLVEMRFHWGSESSNGSEHTLNKRRFPMEMQIVGVAPGFKDVESALLQQSGVAMMGVFIDIGTKRNVHFKAISDAVGKVPYPGDSVTVTPPALLYLMPEKSTKSYYYQGGQTTPPCSQTVDWVVFEKPILISKEQYLQFVTCLYYSNKNDAGQKLLVENYRPIQSSAVHKVFASAAALQIHSERGASHNQHAFFAPLLIPLSLLPFSLMMS